MLCDVKGNPALQDIQNSHFVTERTNGSIRLTRTKWQNPASDRSVELSISPYG